MLGTKTPPQTDRYDSEFKRLEEESSGRGLLPIRRDAFARFAELGFPTTRHEEWRCTNVTRIARTPFELAGRDGVRLTDRDIGPLTFAESAGRRLVFLNGQYIPSLASVDSLPDGVRLGSLAEVLDTDPGAVEPYLARYADYSDDAFTALNTAFMTDGALVEVPAGCTLDTPIHLLYVSTPAARPQVSHPRTLIVVGAGSRATIVESYVGLGPGSYFTNAVTEVIVAEEAVLDHYKITEESDQAFHIGGLRLHQHRGSNLTSHVVSMGGALVRNGIHAVLDGEGCECSLNGFFMLSGRQHVDNHLRVEHAKPHCNSREFFKGILDEQSRGVFSGRIVVHKDAQKTDAKQTNMSLLLSDEAQIDTRPQLEILADDVKCTHGATIGQIDEEAIFYLRSRGIREAAARSLLIYAFANESIAGIHVKSLADRLRDTVYARLPQGHELREVV